MKEKELELEIVCVACGKQFTEFRELLAWHIPNALLESINIKQKPRLKCPSCRGNRFFIRVVRDKYGEYE